MDTVLMILAVMFSIFNFFNNTLNASEFDAESESQDETVG